jgi:phenylalanyl-tRNA synthetase alpha chain
VPDNIYEKIGANLHRRPDHPLAIIKEAIYAYFDKEVPGVFKTFDDLKPVVPVKAVSVQKVGIRPFSSFSPPDFRLVPVSISFFPFPTFFSPLFLLSLSLSLSQNFDEVLVPADHMSRSYNDTYYVSKDTVLRCHTSAHQVRSEHTLLTHMVARILPSPSLFTCRRGYGGKTTPPLHLNKEKRHPYRLSFYSLHLCTSK